ncbi:16S rRNA (uracil(1498)-N(3))-methyltransferase [uncultured Jatrophihabitans sp.]|uniref:16S rRNA (uracil(1498)-N(3))-methyltransferase n=1 Tax=uncultured Jatrophihabitans sp. TaxID=1610747 RepID=UPI0035CBC151
MTPPLFLVAELSADIGDTLILGGDEGRHAARVKRLAVGETVLVGDGRGELAECRVTALRPDSLTLELTSRRTVPQPSPALVLVQALPKGERAELAVELATELGVDEILPWSASRSIVRWDGPRAAKAIERWQRVAREAAKQSRRAWVPEVAAVATTAQVAARIASSAALVLHEDAVQPLASLAVPDAGELLIVVGPEGGIAPDELAAFVAAGALPVRLGDPVLRTSTAGAAALAALSLRLGRWS